MSAHAPSPEPTVGDRFLLRIYLWLVAAVLVGTFTLATRTATGHRLGAIPFEFVPFALTLLGVALLHNRALPIALAGAAVVLAYKLVYVPSFDVGVHFAHEARILANLLGLLVGFALLADHFERSHLAQRVPARLPDGAKGAFLLLVAVWILSAFLDNIAAAILGGLVARVAFAGRVTVAYVAAIVAVANAGGAGSPLGDTTTTMMWIQGAPVRELLPAFVPAFVALLVAGTFAARHQVRHQPIVRESGVTHPPIDGARLWIVACVLVGAVLSNVLLDLPALGVWVALLLLAGWRAPAWREIGPAAKGACFLLSLVVAASMMPVDGLPEPSLRTTFGLGMVSSIFDNIPLTKLALQQNGYDWGALAFAVGYGGSMTWFGSSAGVAITQDFPQARNLGRYLKDAWIVVVAYALAFAVYALLFDWRPTHIAPAGSLP